MIPSCHVKEQSAPDKTMSELDGLEQHCRLSFWEGDSGVRMWVKTKSSLTCLHGEGQLSRLQSHNLVRTISINFPPPRHLGCFTGGKPKEHDRHFRLHLS